MQIAFLSVNDLISRFFEKKAEKKKLLRGSHPGVRAGSLYSTVGGSRQVVFPETDPDGWTI